MTGSLPTPMATKTMRAEINARFPPCAPPAMTLTPWTVQASRLLFSDRWLRVRADNCTTAQGVAVAPYYVLEYPDWAHAVVFNGAGEVMVTRQYRHGSGGVCAELPGGIVDPGDESPLAAAQREVREETGYAAPQWHALSHARPNPATHANTVHAFAAYDAALVSPPAPDAGEEIEVDGVSVPALLGLIDDGTFCQAQQIGSVFLALRHAGLLSFSPHASIAAPAHLKENPA